MCSMSFEIDRSHMKTFPKNKQNIGHLQQSFRIHICPHGILLLAVVPVLGHNCFVPASSRSDIKSHQIIPNVAPFTGTEHSKRRCMAFSYRMACGGFVEYIIRLNLLMAYCCLWYQWFSIVTTLHMLHQTSNIKNQMWRRSGYR